MTSTPTSPDSTSTGFVAVLDSRALWILWGLAMAVMGTRVPEWAWPPQGGQITELTVCAVLGMVLAAPQRGRPVYVSNRWAARLLTQRNTMLPAGFVLLVAAEHPTVLDAGIDTALLAGYLLLLDAATMPTAVFRRIASPLFLVVPAAVVVSATAIVAMPGSASPVHRILTAVIGLAVVGVAVAAAFLSGETRRVGSQGPESLESDVSEVHP